MDQKNLENIKTVLNIESADDDALLEILMANAMNTIMVYLGVNVDEFPAQLNFIAEELTIARYRKIGAEGISTEKIDEISTTYSINDLNRYKDVLKAYKDNNLGGKKLKTL
jgi:hypothetical protein